MAYVVQTFTAFNVLTAAQMNQVQTDLDDIRSLHKGPTAPAALTAGILWLEDDNPDATAWTLQIRDATAWTTVGIFNVGDDFFGWADGLVTKVGSGPALDPNCGWYRIGADNWAGATAGAKVIEFMSDGAIKYALKPLVIARQGTVGTDVTGAGVSYTVPFQTEVVDRGGDFATPTVTFPHTGAYLVIPNISLLDVAATHTRAFVSAVLTGQDQFAEDLPTIGTMAPGRVMIGKPIMVNVAGGDTMTITVSVAGGTQVVDVDADALFTTALYVVFLG